jgi:hypothetical protein
MKVRSLEKLDDLRKKGLALTYPDKIKIMVGMATCGISAGADKVYEALKAKIDELKLDVALEKTGCIGFCQREPLVDVVYPKKVRNGPTPTPIPLNSTLTRPATKTCPSSGNK